MQYFSLILLVLLTACDNHSQQLALGTLERDRISHTATVNEVIVSLPVSAGSHIKQGDLLVQLDDTEQKAHVAHAQAEVAQAQANLDKLRKGPRIEDIAVAKAIVAGAKAKTIASEANYKRAKNMAKSNLSSQANLDTAIADRDFDLANLHSTQQQLTALLKGTREEDLRSAQAILDATQASLAGEEKKLADLSITASREGILDNLPWNLGERVTQGSPLAIVLAGKAPFARIYVPETSRAKVAINDTLTVHIDGIERPIKGRVRWISNEPAFTPYYGLNQQDRARLMYLAEIQLPDSEANLPNGVPAQVELP